MKEMKYETYLEFFYFFVLPATCSVSYWELMTPSFCVVTSPLTCNGINLLHQGYNILTTTIYMSPISEYVKKYPPIQSLQIYSPLLCKVIIFL